MQVGHFRTFLCYRRERNMSLRHRAPVV
jgi:hypothetical protein